jgi:hypothetical protein
VTDDGERELRMAQMRADIANKDADILLKTEQARWEPWKALSAAFGAGLAGCVRPDRAGGMGAVARDGALMRGAPAAAAPPRPAMLRA